MILGIKFEFTSNLFEVIVPHMIIFAIIGNYIFLKMVVFKYVTIIVEKKINFCTASLEESLMSFLKNI